MKLNISSLGYFKNLFFMILFVMCSALIFGSDECATASDSQDNFHIEARAGIGMICGSCRLISNNDNFKHRQAGPVGQIFGDKLFRFKKHFGMGPYLKASLIENTSQFGGGILFEYSFKKVSYLSHIGLAYSTKRLGDIDETRLGQTKETYDLGLFSRISLKKDYYLSFGVGHNSSGRQLGINFFGGEGNNPGFDYIFAGFGKKF